MTRELPDIKISEIPALDAYLVEHPLPRHIMHIPYSITGARFRLGRFQLRSRWADGSERWVTEGVRALTQCREDAMRQFLTDPQWHKA